MRCSRFAIEEVKKRKYSNHSTLNGLDCKIFPRVYRFSSQPNENIAYW